MYNVDITAGSIFVGASGNVSIAAASYSSAIRHYKAAFGASVRTTGNRTVLETKFGFRIRVDASRGGSKGSIRVKLPPKVSREGLAKALGGRSGRMSRSRSGVSVQDPFGITWIIA